MSFYVKYLPHHSYTIHNIILFSCDKTIEITSMSELVCLSHKHKKNPEKFMCIYLIVVMMVYYLNSISNLILIHECEYNYWTNYSFFHLQFLTKQVNSMKEESASRAKIYEQLESSICELERTNSQLSRKHEVDKKRIQRYESI